MKVPAFSPEDTYVTIERSSEVSNMPYRIGKPNRGKERNSGLDIDPEAKTVRLVVVDCGLEKVAVRNGRL